MGMDSNNCRALIRNKKKPGLLKDTDSRVGRVLKQNHIKDADNSTRTKARVRFLIRNPDESVAKEKL